MDISEDRSLSPQPHYASRRNSGASAATSVTYPLVDDSAARHTLDTVQRLHTKLHDITNDNSKLDDTNAKLRRQLRDQIDKNAELQKRLTEAESSLSFADQRHQADKRQYQITNDKLEDQLITIQMEKVRMR